MSIFSCVTRAARQLAVAALALCAAWATPAATEIRQTAGAPVQIEPLVQGLNQPWAFGFLPGGHLLITERGGTLLHIGPDGARSPVGGVPDVAVIGQGGLLDLLVPRDFAESRAIFLSYAKVQDGGGQGTALATGRLSADHSRLEDVRLLYEMAPGTGGGRHFGSRLVEGPDGALFMTIGDRGQRQRAQDLSLENGTVLRLNRDGTVPADNPFQGQGDARPAIWSYGHRNAQGAALDRQGQLWVVEHGAQGGDEVNRIQKGANFGWPVISYGRHYSGARIGEGTQKPGMVQPAFYWDPSIAPSGMTFYDGAAFPDWQGHLFVGSLKFDMISRLVPQGDGFAEAERIAAPETGRVRDIRTGPDGALWFLSVNNGTLYRMSPAP